MATQPRKRGLPPEDATQRRGLPSIEKAREARNKRARPSLKVAVWFGLVVLVGTSLYWYRSSSNVEQDRQRLMADQRGVESELGKRWYPLRDQIEQKTIALANNAEPEVIEKDELAKFRFQEKPGIYLRVRLDQAKSVESIRDAAKSSLRDGFTSCLMRTAGEDPLAGALCTTLRDCTSGQICNDLGHCALPTQPYNLRTAYHSMYVLTPDWVKDVQDAGDDLRIRALRLAFDDAAKSDLPVAVDLLTKATFFMAVIDERPAPPKPPSASTSSTSGGRDTPTPEDIDVLDGKRYASRVAVWRLEDGKLLLRIRREPSADAIMGGMPSANQVAEAARLRQAQSCALALDVRAATGDEAVGPAHPQVKDDAPVPSASASAPPSASASALPSASAAPSASAKPSSSAKP